jgi:hypothetical protein
MDRTEIAVPSALRFAFIIVALVMLGLWSWSLVPVMKSWGNPNEDGFSYVPAFWATITSLPVGLYLLAGGITAREPYVARARKALAFGCALVFIVAAFLVFQHIANDGR